MNIQIRLEDINKDIVENLAVAASATVDVFIVAE